MNNRPLDHPFPSIFQGPNQSPGFQFWRKFLIWQRELNALLAPLKLTQPQFSVLAITAWLTRKGDTATQQQIADFSGLDRMTVSQLVRRLEKREFVARTRPDNDKRAWNISPTDQGLACLSRAAPLVEAFDVDFFPR